MKKSILIILMAVLGLAPMTAQINKRTYSNMGWQFNAPIANDFVDKAQGYGAYYQGGYYFAPYWAVGGFISYNSNNGYIPTETYVFDDGTAVTTDMHHSLYQVPFGATLRYRFSRSTFQPYIEAKVGTVYSTQGRYLSVYMREFTNWGFYISPEIGFSVHPFYLEDFGFHFALYYSYSTNQNEFYGIGGLNNLGFKLGIAF